MKYSRMRAFLVVGLLGLAACDLGPNPMGEVRVLLAGAPSMSANAGDALSTQSVPIALSMIDLFEVDVWAIEANNGDNESGWQQIELLSAPQQRINLIDLPFEGSGTFELATGDLEVGSYNHIRLRFDETTIKVVLNQDVTLGDGTVLPAGGYLVRVPSGTENGLKIHTASFEVTEDATATVNLIFDGPVSLGNLHTTGNGSLIMSPVLRSPRD